MEKDLEKIKRILRRGRKNRTVFITSSYENIIDINSSEKNITVVFIPINIHKKYVDIEVLAASSYINMSSRIKNVWYSILTYDDVEGFREWKLDDAPLTLYFDFLSEAYKKLAFNL